MSGYLIKNSEGRWMTPERSQLPYTKQTARARVFTTEDEANRHRVGNDQIVPVDEIYRDHQK